MACNEDNPASRIILHSESWMRHSAHRALQLIPGENDEMFNRFENDVGWPGRRLGTTGRLRRFSGAAINESANSRQSLG
jgi:hypothetical protein